jgi:type IV secretion system protein VirD4
MAAANGRQAAQRGLLLGWAQGDAAGSPGFARREGASPEKFEAVYYDGDAPLLTLGTTGSGKGRGAVIVNALLHDGPLIALDIKAEILHVAGRHRQRMGPVVVFDPFHIAVERSAGLNPFDLLSLPGSNVECDAEMLATLLSAGHEFRTDPFWNDMANGLVGGLIAHVATTGSPANRHLGRVREWLFNDDMDMAIARALDANAVPNRMAREQLVSYLAAPIDRTRPSIRTVACSYVNALGCANVAETLRASTFNLRDVMDGRRMSIFICIPPDKLESHKSLLRLYLGTLMTAISRRKCMPRQRTLCIIDECAQLGTLSALRQATTLLRGSGLQVWSFWQDLSQLKLLYPQDWQTMVNNSAVIQAFGVNNHMMAQELSALFGRQPGELLGMRLEEEVLHVQGQGSRICRRPDYLRDPLFAGLFDPNPRFALQERPAAGSL